MLFRRGGQGRSHPGRPRLGFPRSRRTIRPLWSAPVAYRSKARSASATSVKVEPPPAVALIPRRGGWIVQKLLRRVQMPGDVVLVRGVEASPPVDLRCLPDSRKLGWGANSSPRYPLCPAPSVTRRRRLSLRRRIAVPEWRAETTWSVSLTGASQPAPSRASHSWPKAEEPTL